MIQCHHLQKREKLSKISILSILYTLFVGHRYFISSKMKEFYNCATNLLKKLTRYTLKPNSIRVYEEYCITAICVFSGPISTISTILTDKMSIISINFILRNLFQRISITSQIYSEKTFQQSFFIFPLFQILTKLHENFCQ